MANMMNRIWSGPADQETPKASLSSAKSEERNPFDALTPAPAPAPAPTPAAASGAPNDRLAPSSMAHQRGDSGGSLKTMLQQQPGDGLRTPGGVTSHASVPTTSVSTTAPDFTMKLPPAKAKPETSSAGSATATRNTSAPRGRLTVKLVGGRNLGAHVGQPYAVVSFEQNEFIARKPLAKGARSSASASSSHDGAQDNPVWDHEAAFDVVYPDKPVFVSVYDRDAAEEGFLGMRLIRPRMVHGVSTDQWYPLVARDDAEEDDQQGRGEIRVQLRYERLTSKKHLTPADFDFLSLIGRGTFGRVFQVRKRDTKRIYAMKVLSKREIALKKEVTHTMGERKILEKSLDCPFLVGLKFSFQSAQELYFVTDYKSGGELFWHLQREGRFTEERARFYIAELVLALEHLHKYDIVYRDLKPENILLDATGHVALCDFGLSKPDLGAGQLTNTFCGTTEYLAPEVLLDESGYSKLVDFWSLGVLLFEMCCGWSPFYAEDTQQMYRNICFGKIKFPRGAIGDDGKQFVKGLLNRNPKHRLGAVNDAADLRNHAFFKDIDFEALSRKQLTPPFKPSVESDESVANFDPEFTETDLKQMAFIPGFDGDANASKAAIHNGAILNNNGSGGDGPHGVAIGKDGAKDAGVGPKAVAGVAGGKSGDGGDDDDDDDNPLSRSVQDKFRGFSYSGTYDGSVAGSFGGRRGSGGFGLAGASLGMSKMQMDDDDDDDGNDDGGPRRASHAQHNGGDAKMSEAEEEAAGRPVSDVDMDP
ncbi:kinase-like protein [Acaromyces ingoldii]|uniref:Kinase-like protein n=1 Tax=Acaromyces ingoldii TaxID=215250 RepID=A0A316YFP5_9BASI|nr:kinase-like protein [Acaromyces ingoldii]PWN87664.1 kinase-like protein [Acaromyces ingoldii]